MQKKLTLASIILTLLLANTQALATDITLLVGKQFNDDFEIAINDGYTLNPALLGEPGDDLGLESGPAVSLAVDFLFNSNPNQRIGLYLSHHQTQFESGAGLVDEDMDITHIHFTAMNYYPNGNWEPFIMAGLGAAIFSPADKSLDSTTKFSAQIGAGSNYKITEHLLLRFEARWIPTFFNGNSSGICSGGCVIVLKSDMYSQVQANIGLQFRF